MRYKLGEICKPKQWKTISTEMLEKEGYPVYGANGIIGYYKEYNHAKATLLVTCRGATCGSLNICKPYSYINGNAMALDELRNDVDIKYLYYFLKARGFDDVISGSAQPQIIRSAIERIEVNVQDETKQKEIVKKFEIIEEIIANQKEQLRQLDELIKSRFVELFGDAVKNNKGWPIKRLKELSIQINNGNTPKGGEQVYVEKGIVFFRSQNVWKNKLEMDDIAYIDKKTHASMSRSSLKHGDILMTKTGRINTENSSLGRAALYMGEDDAANINGHVYFIRLKPEVNNKFILRILVSNEYRDYIRSVCVGGIDKRQLNKNHIEDFPIICPPSDMVDAYIQFVEIIDKLKVELLTKNPKERMQIV